jgi:hypothetical protein
VLRSRRRRGERRHRERARRELATPGTVGGAALLGFLAYGVSLVLFVRAIRSLGTACTGASFSLAPFVGGALGLALFRERVTVPFAAATLMAAALWLRLKECHEHAHGSMEHAHVHEELRRHAHALGDPAATDPEPHSHPHRHEPLVHTYQHYRDIHRHRHG